jgi:hypothetical protein
MADAVGNGDWRIEGYSISGDRRYLMHLAGGAVAVGEPAASRARIVREGARSKVVNVLVGRMCPERANVPPSLPFGEPKTIVPVKGVPSLQLTFTVETTVPAGVSEAIFGVGGLKLISSDGALGINATSTQ